MTGMLLAPLIATLRPHFELGKTRLETLAVLLVELANGRTINLSHLASQFPGPALHASNYRRLQRFFQFVRLDTDTAIRLVVRILTLGQPRLLALDRTQWALGSSEVNILVLAVVTRRFQVPLVWTLLDHRGCSNTEQRIDLMERYVRLFGASSIKAVLADREFIGTEWIEFLNENNIPFVIRLKENMRFQREDGSVRDFPTLLRKHRRGTWTGWLSDMKTTAEGKLQFAAKRIRNGELLIVATNLDDGPRSLNLYRRRWDVECLLADAKTRGFNSEDTHITDPAKLGNLLVIIALAVTWAYRCATRIMGRKDIRRKMHVRREKSWFRTRFDALRNWIIHNPESAVAAWTHRYPRKHLQPLQTG